MSLPDPIGNAGGDAAVAGAPAAAADVDWDAVRAVYEGDLTVSNRVILERFGINKYRLQQRVVLFGWTPRRKTKRGVSRASLIKRMLEAVERHLDEVLAADLPIERRTTMLSSMSRTLAKVLDLEKDRRRGKRGKKSSEELLALREKIAKRIDQLNQG